MLMVSLEYLHVHIYLYIVELMPYVNHLQPSAIVLIFQYSA